MESLASGTPGLYTFSGTTNGLRYSRVRYRLASGSSPHVMVLASK